MKLTESQMITILSAYAIITAYYLVCLYAAWMRPSLRRYRLLRPWWRGGVTASRSGVTAQAAFAFSLSLFGIAKMFNLWWQSGAKAMFFLSIATLLFTLLTDQDQHTNGSR
jgi:hypothetical protein